MRHLLRVGVAVMLLALAGVLSAQTAQDVAALRQWAEAGDADAQFNLAVRYAIGRGVPQDDTQAVAWFGKAADQGEARAQLSLGVMYEDGVGVPQDEVLAYMWFNLAASRSSGDAQKTNAVRRDRVLARLTPLIWEPERHRPLSDIPAPPNGPPPGREPGGSSWFMRPELGGIRSVRHHGRAGTGGVCDYADGGTASGRCLLPLSPRERC
ncbi:MAG: sel1 repeat family protein [SAR202 cluster bacterium]|nr:sel1 repeat family protein [SAR202 cluster bacterium]